jgi:hypothetical protein
MNDSTFGRMIKTDLLAQQASPFRRDRENPVPSTHRARITIGVNVGHAINPPSCSQNAAYSATIMAAQIRSARAQLESGNPTTVTVGRALCTRVMATANPNFSDYPDRRGHTRWIQQSTLAREDLANFCGFKYPLRA